MPESEHWLLVVFYHMQERDNDTTVGDSLYFVRDFNRETIFSISSFYRSPDQFFGFGLFPDSHKQSNAAKISGARQVFTSFDYKYFFSTRTAVEL